MALDLSGNYLTIPEMMEEKQRALAARTRNPEAPLPAAPAAPKVYPAWDPRSQLNPNEPFQKPGPFAAAPSPIGPSMLPQPLPQLSPTAAAPAARRPAPRRSLASTPTQGPDDDGAPAGHPQSHEPVPEGQESYAAAAPGAEKPETPREKLIRMLTETPDAAPLIEAARKREEGGNRDFAAAMALQAFGGKSFSPLAGHVLTQAMKAREEKEIPGGWGTVTSEGVVWNPQKVKEAQLQQYQHLMDLDDKQLARAQLEAERREREAGRREDREAARQDRIMLAQIAAGRGDSRRDDARAAQVDRVGGQVMDDYVKSVKDERIILSAYDNLKVTAKRSDGPSDISFIFQYMKMLDPSSVVREGEFATAQNSGSVPDNIRNMYNRAVKGTRLNDQQKSQFLGAAERLAGAAEGRMQTRQREFEPRLRAVGADPTIYLPGYRAPVAPAADPTGRGTAANPIVVNPGATTPNRRREDTIKSDF